MADLTGDAAAAAAALERASILEDAADDPALASCCVRDLEAQAKAERVKARLAAADRVEARVRAAAAPPPLVSSVGGANDDDDGAALASIRAARLAQMQAAAARQQQQQQAAAGGTLEDLKGGKALWRLVEGQQQQGRGAAAASSDPLAGLAPPIPPVIAHLYLPGAPGGAATDEVLANLAAGSGGAARFVRVRVDAPGVADGVGLPGSSTPVLVAFRGGALVAKAPVAAFMGEEEGGGGGEEAGPEEAGLVAWLRAARVLPKARGGDDPAAGAAASSDDEDDEEEREGVDPCPECGRTYEHTHIRSARAGWTGGGGGSSSSEDE